MSHQHMHHHHAPSSGLGVAFLLNLGFALFELVGGLLTNSVAILSDATHDFGDSLSLGLAWLLDRYSRKGEDQRYSYGYRRFSLLGAVITALILISGSIYIASEAVERLFSPEPFNAPGMLLIAVVGIAVNGAAILRLRQNEAMNARMIRLHLLEDVLGWVAVLIVGVVSLFVNLPILDPLLSLGITAYVLYRAVGSLSESVRLLLQAVPRNVDVSVIERKLLAVAGVQSTHHTHVWSLDGEHNVLTTHLVVSRDMEMRDIQRIKQETSAAIRDLHLEHATIEIEYGEGDCSVANTV